MDKVLNNNEFYGENTPLISILIPVYNTELYLKKCFESVCNQTYKKIEIIIVNDGSTDGSEEIIKEYMKKDSRIIYVKNDKNQGLFKARLRGYEKANGEYIACLDSDDYVEVDYYRSLLECSKKENADIVVSDFIEDIEDRNVKCTWVQNHLLSNLKLEGDKVIQTFLDTCFLTSNWWFMWNKLYKKELWDKCYLDFIKVDYNVTYLEDFLYGNILISKAQKYVHTNINSYHYVRHKTSCTGVGNSASTYLKHSKSKVYVIDFLKKYYKKTNWYGIAEVELEKYKGKHRRDDIEKVWGSTSKIEEKEETVKLIEEMYGEVKDVLQKDSYFMRKEGIDNRYEDIKKSILYSQHEIISFDIFDTLILRPFYKPSDLFTLLNPYFESICSERPFSEFSKIREDAEIQVRRINKQKYPQLEEIRLHDIYDYISQNYDISKTVIEQMEMKEVQLEIEFSEPRKSVQSLYNLAISANKKVICISDIYLDKKTIQQILQKNGYTFFDEIYLSSEIGLVKSTGSLFDYVAHKINVRPERILHIGDTWKSDIVAAREKGLKTFFIPKAIECFENKIPPHKRSHIMDMILKEIPGNWVRYKYAYNQFGIRCMCAIVANKFFDNPFLGFDENTDFNIDPYFIGYFALGMHNFAIAYWLLQNAKEKYRKIHFVARDGYATKIIYEHLKKIDSEAPESNYLYLSRKAMLPLVVSRKEDFFMLDEWVNIKLYTPREFLENMHELIPIAFDHDFEREMRDDGIILDAKFKNREEYLAFSQVIIKKYLKEDNINIYRNKMKKYFENFIGKHEAMFDIGYSGRGQAVLSDLLGIKIDAFYIHTIKDTWHRLSRDRKFKIFSFYNFVPTIIGRQREVLQSDTHPSCVGYKEENGKIIPIFEDKEMRKMGRYIMQTIHRGMEDFCIDFLNKFNRYLKLMYFENFDVSFAHEWLMSKVKPRDLHVFSEITFDDDMMEGFVEKPLSEIWLNDVKYFSFYRPTSSKKATNIVKNVNKDNNKKTQDNFSPSLQNTDDVIYPENRNIPLNIQKLSRWKRIFYYTFFEPQVISTKLQRVLKKKDEKIVINGKLINKRKMSFYYILSSYQLLCCIVHKLVYNKDREAVVFLSKYRAELYPRLLKSGIFGDNVFLWDDSFFNDYFKDKDSKVDSYSSKDWENVEKEVFNMLEQRLPFDIHGFHDYYLSSDVEIIGNYFIYKKIKYNYFEDAAGIFTHTEITKNNNKRLFTHAKISFSERFPINGKNPNIKKIFMKFSAQKPEVKLPSNAVDLDVMRMMRKLEDHDKSLIFDVFGVKSLTIPPNEQLTLLLTQQMYAFKKMSKVDQNNLYLSLVDYFKPENTKLVVKPHPDDTYSDYKALFPDCIVLGSKVLSEFLPVIIDNNYKMGITANSMSVFNLGEYIENVIYFNPEIEITWRYFDLYYVIAKIVNKLSDDRLFICKGGNVTQLNLILNYLCDSNIKFIDDTKLKNFNNTKKVLFLGNYYNNEALKYSTEDIIISQTKITDIVDIPKRIIYKGNDSSIKKPDMIFYVNKQFEKNIKSITIEKVLKYTKISFECNL